MTKLTIVTEDNMIILNNEAIKFTHTDISWIPSNVWAVQWDSEKNGGEGIIEYRREAEKGQDKITSLGIYSQAITDHATEKTAIANAYEASRNHLDEVKNYRNIMLTQSDWTQGNDSPLSSSKKTEWATYRQSLRDIPATIAADSNLTAKAMADDFTHSSWPTKPS